MGVNINFTLCIVRTTPATVFQGTPHDFYNDASSVDQLNLLLCTCCLTVAVVVDAQWLLARTHYTSTSHFTRLLCLGVSMRLHWITSSMLPISHTHSCSKEGKQNG